MEGEAEQLLSSLKGHLHSLHGESNALDELLLALDTRTNAIRAVEALLTDPEAVRELGKRTTFTVARVASSMGKVASQWTSSVEPLCQCKQALESLVAAEEKLLPAREKELVSGRNEERLMTTLERMSEVHNLTLARILCGLVAASDVAEDFPSQLQRNAEKLEAAV